MYLKVVLVVFVLDRYMKIVHTGNIVLYCNCTIVGHHILLRIPTVIVLWNKRISLLGYHVKKSSFSYKLDFSIKKRKGKKRKIKHVSLQR